MTGFFYYLLTFAESVTSVFGIRSVYEQPRYTVVQDLGQSTEVRRYEPRLAVEAIVANTDRDQAASEAFSLLFRYITGANQREQKIAMTAPVRTQTGLPEADQIAMTAPVRTAVIDGRLSMRFFLPQTVARAGAPQPLDPRLHLVQVPETTIAALRYSGVATQATRDHNAAILTGVLAKSVWKPSGPVFQFSYDPPFTVPMLRRNEVAVEVAPQASPPG